MAAPRTPARRRQRSVRVTVALFLLALATVAVLLALPTQSPVLLSIAAVGAVVLGWGALRIMWTEVLQSRREHATDRAATAQAYRSLFSQRASEHAEFTTAMTERLAESVTSVRELQAALAAEQREAAVVGMRATAATAEANRLRRELDEARSEAESARAAARAAEAVAAEAAEGFIGPRRGSVQELVTWDQQVSAIKAEQDRIRKAVRGA